MVLGGTAVKKGRDKGFIDSSHIAGQGIILGQCTVSMLCGNQTASPYGFTADDSTTTNLRRLRDENNDNAAAHGCYTAPFVRCGSQTHWTPLWNLHVHSKHTLDYRSVPCFCPTNVNE